MGHATASASRKHVFFLLSLGLMLLETFFPAQVRSSDKPEVAYPQTAQGVMDAFCRSDYVGDGLSSQTWPRMQRYTAWEDAPGWDRIIVVSAFRRSGEHGSDTQAQIVVKYDVVATIEAGEKLSQVTFVTESQQVSFQLEFLNGEWKIVEPQEPPHISVEKAIERLKQEVRHEKNKRIAQRQTDVVNALQRILQ